jgi:hypothetical protein
LLLHEKNNHNNTIMKQDEVLQLYKQINKIN